jgi:hypothetical protein
MRTICLMWILVTAYVAVVAGQYDYVDTAVYTNEGRHIILIYLRCVKVLERVVMRSQ